MDNLTHSLFAATLAATPLRTAGRGATVALVLASNAPDIDIITALTGGGQVYLAAHRGATHGPLGIVALALATATLVSLTHRGTRFWRLLALSILGVLLHVALDVPTSYGTRLLSPWSETWYALDWLPIIDIYLWMILAIGTLVAWSKASVRIIAAVTTLAAMIAFYGIRAAAHDVAVRRAGTSAATCRVRGLAAWEPGGRSGGAGAATVSALPRFLSPFAWRLIEQNGRQYVVTDVDLLRGTMTTPVRIAVDDGPAVAGARSAEAVRSFLDFARYPIAQSVSGEGSTVVRWHDLRFLSPVGPLDLTRAPRRGLFTVSVLVDESGRVLEERFGR